MFNAPRFVVYDFAKEETPASAYQDLSKREGINESLENTESKTSNVLDLFANQNYVFSNENLSSSEFNLATKIFSAIARSDIKVEGVASELFLNLQDTLQSLPEMKLVEHINLVRTLNANFKVAIYFSSQNQYTSSKIYQGSKTLIWIQTYSLEQIAMQPNLKAEFWNYLKELK